jgi:hypothetical protein
MDTGKGIGLIIVAIAAIVIVSILFQDSEMPPNVDFYQSPELAEEKIAKGFSTNIKVAARNYDSAPVHDVEVHMTITEGGNWENHLEFDPVTVIDRKLEPGESTAIPKYIQVKAQDVSGIEPKFKIHLELFANGTSTGNTWEKYIILTE